MVLGAAGSRCPPWTLYRVDKWSPTAEGEKVDPDSDQPVELRESREYFAVEWEEGAALPSQLLATEEQATGSGSRSGSRGPQRGEQDLKDLLAMFIEDEQLGPDDAWYCNRCKCHREAWKKLEFHRLPPVLVLQLKRFQFTRYSRDRLDIPVDFPLEGLYLSPYCTASSRRKGESTVYDLAGMSKHIGSLGGGHYVAYCRSSEDGTWFNFDDGCVRRVPAEEVEQDKVGAYVLFYIRRDHRPQGFGAPASVAHPPA